MTERLSQPRLALEVRRLTDEAMIVRPDYGPNRQAMRQLRELLAAYPEALSKSHIRWNLGERRLSWLEALLRRWAE
jgi:hypothetical protein